MPPAGTAGKEFQHLKGPAFVARAIASPAEVGNARQDTGKACRTASRRVPFFLPPQSMWRQTGGCEEGRAFARRFSRHRTGVRTVPMPTNQVRRRPSCSPSSHSQGDGPWRKVSSITFSRLRLSAAGQRGPRWCTVLLLER